MAGKQRPLWDREIVLPAMADSFKKLSPASMVRNPVMFVTEIGAAITTVGLIFRPAGEAVGFALQIAIWLWFTVLFASFAEALAEGRGKAQARALRRMRVKTIASQLMPNGKIMLVPADQLRKGDVYVVSAGETIPADGER